MADNQILAFIIILVLIIALPILFALTKYLGSKSENIRKQEPYESGIRSTHKDPYDTFNVKFFLVGIIFLLFDVEILFMFPWSVNLIELGFFGMVEMFTFMGLLIVGLIYIYKSGVLKWT